MSGASNARVWITIIFIVFLIWFITHSGPAKIPGIGPLWVSLSMWFKNVTGISLDQIVLAIWRLIIWVIKTLLNLIWMALSWVLNLVRG